MNEDLRTYILENMDEGTVINIERKKEKAVLDKKIKTFRDDISYSEVPMDACYNMCKEDEDVMYGSMMEEETCLPNMSLDDYIKNHMDKYNDFQKTLFKMIDERKLTDSEVYNKVNVSRKTFSKIRNEEDYHPSKETVILLGISLELNLEDMEYLLSTASYAMPKNNAYDLIIRYCFHKNIYDLYQINEMLDEYNCKLLSI